MPFDASTSKRVKRSSFSDKSRAANFNKSERPAKGPFKGAKGSKAEPHSRGVFRDGQKVGNESHHGFVDHDPTGALMI